MKELNKEMQDSRLKSVLEETDVHYLQRYQNNEKHGISCNTLEDLALTWLQGRYGMIKKSTYSGYYYCIKMHILPYFGTMSLTELNGEAVLAFMENIQQKGLANSTVRSVLVVFKSIMKYGVQTNLIRREILVYCTVSCRRTESRALMIQETLEMKEYLLEKDTIFSLAILLCRGTGIRIGELCGLKWEDIDFTSNTISIRRTISRIPNPDPLEGQPRTVLYIRTPKSHTSMREIPIPQYLVQPLQNKRKEKSQYILTGNEMCTEPRNVQKKFKTILRHCNMEDCNFHAMRHGFATACLEKGIDCKTVSSILGHASTRTTMDFYLHTSMRQKKDCIDAVD